MPDMSDSDNDLAADAASQVGIPFPTPRKVKREAAETAGPSPAKGANGGKTKAAKAASASSGTFACTLCCKSHECADKVPGFNWGRSCKRAYDSLKRLAVKQQEKTARATPAYTYGWQRSVSISRSVRARPKM